MRIKIATFTSTLICTQISIWISSVASIMKRSYENVPAAIELYQITADSIRVSWTSSHHVKSYVVSYGSNGPFDNEFNTTASTNSVIIDNLLKDHEYTVLVRSILLDNTVSTGIQDSILLDTGLTLPPTELRIISTTATQLYVSWYDDSNPRVSFSMPPVNYIVEYTLSHANIGHIKSHLHEITKSQITNTTRCYIKGLNPFSRYEIRVKRIKSNVNSDWSLILEAMTKNSAPLLPPSKLDISPDLSNPSSVTISWDRGDGEWDPDFGYVLIYTDSPKKPLNEWFKEVYTPSSSKHSIDRMQHQIQNLKFQTLYSFMIYAKNSMGSGPLSEMYRYRTLNYILNEYGNLSAANILSTARQIWANLSQMFRFIILIVLLCTPLICACPFIVCFRHRATKSVRNKVPRSDAIKGNKVRLFDRFQIESSHSQNKPKSMLPPHSSESTALIEFDSEESSRNLSSSVSTFNQSDNSFQPNTNYYRNQFEFGDERVDMHSRLNPAFQSKHRTSESSSFPSSGGNSQHYDFRSPQQCSSVAATNENFVSLASVRPHLWLSPGNRSSNEIRESFPMFSTKAPCYKQSNDQSIEMTAINEIIRDLNKLPSVQHY
ncbi:hypothetical protein GJ496_010046 [Pomphorhynchus laevis]|nr:hypothetical protein GJ496_010046 [Pomphorhynchus laevis]